MQCLSKHKWRGRRQAPSGTHKSREETEEKDERQKTKTKKEASTTRCAQINTARPASNPDTLTTAENQFHCTRLYIIHSYCYNQCIAQSPWEHHFVGSVVHHPAVLLHVSNPAIISPCDNSPHPFPTKLAEVKIVQLTSHPSLCKNFLFFFLGSSLGQRNNIFIKRWR